MIRYSIRDIEKITGIKAHTIRIWEKRYGIVQPLRTQTNIRYYSDEDLRHLMNVALLNKSGYKISTIQGMSATDIMQSVVDLNNSVNNLDHQIDDLVMAMIELDEKRFDKIITSSIIQHGFEYTFVNFLYRFLEKAGLLWQVGSVSPAQEHFISHLIRQKLILAIDGQHEYLEKNKIFVLFLPENEYHELALLYMHYLIRRAGHMVIYLGQNVPLVDLKNIFEIHKTDYLLTSITANRTEEDNTEFFNEFTKLYGEKNLLLGGNSFHNNYSFPPYTKFFKSIPDFTDFLLKL